LARRLLIINADDFGASESVNRAVVEAHRAGTVTSASLMAGGPAFDPAVSLAAGLPGLGLGLHFQLTQGRPLSGYGQVPSICGEGGAFLSRRRLLGRLLGQQVRPGEIRIELEAQLQVLEENGLKPSHIDGHQHVHVLPGVINIVLEEAWRRGLAVRVPLEELVWTGGRMKKKDVFRAVKKLAFRPLALRARQQVRAGGLVHNDHFRSIFGLVPEPERIDVQAFRPLLENLRPGVTEIMVHPAWEPDCGHLWDQGLLKDRLEEAWLLAGPELGQALAQEGFRLTNYRELTTRP